MISDKTYKTLMNIAIHGDGFQWNPYSTSDIHRAAGRAKKKGLLVRNKKFIGHAKWPFLIPVDPKQTGGGS